jgi:hypothetical protein
VAPPILLGHKVLFSSVSVTGELCENVIMTDGAAKR